MTRIVPRSLAPAWVALLSTCGALGCGPSTTEPVVPKPSSSASASPEALALPPPGGPVCSERPPLSGTVTIARVELRGLGATKEHCDRVRTRAGSAVDDELATEDLRALFSTGELDDVTVLEEPTPLGPLLVFELVSRPRLGDVRVEGAGPHAADLTRELSAARRFDRAFVPRATAALREALGALGYRASTVNGVARPDAVQGKVDVTFTIELGPRTAVRKVLLEGVTPAYEKGIRALLGVKPGEVLAPLVLDRDDLVATAYYYDRGHVLAQVEHTLVDVAKSPDVDVRFKVTEGPKFKLRSIDVRGELGPPKAEYTKITAPLKPGAVFDRSAVAKVLEALHELHKREKHAADVTPETELDHEKKTIAIVFRVTKGK